VAGGAARTAIARLMQFEDGPQLPLTPRRKVLVGVGATMFAAQCGAAIALAPATTGADADADAARLAMIRAASIVWSVTAVLLLVRQADLPDVATASFMVTISAFAIFAVTGALHVRGTSSEVNITDTMFLGVTTGALTALIVWALAMGAARALRLPTTATLRDEESG
jgi:hypothetical protein